MPKKLASSRAVAIGYPVVTHHWQWPAPIDGLNFGKSDVLKQTNQASKSMDISWLNQVPQLTPPFTMILL